jgi:RNase adaptor protein for sRNA GlmZ degradation
MMASARVISFGFLHGPAPVADVVLDVRDVLHDPHVTPEFRELTGLDERVRRYVLDTADATFIVTNLVNLAYVLDTAALARADRPVTVAIGCAGGRHRSVALASVVAERLTADGWSVAVEHRHVGRPVVRRGGA